MTNGFTPDPGDGWNLTTSGYQPVTGEAIPASTVLSALSTVLLWTLSDTFELLPEERAWVKITLDTQVLSPMKRREPVQIPTSVRQEALEGSYTRQLEQLALTTPTPSVQRPRVQYAGVDDWAATFADLVELTYRLGASEGAEVFARFRHLLTDLGVGDPSQPRGSTFLPNTVMDRLANRSI